MSSEYNRSEYFGERQDSGDASGRVGCDYGVSAGGGIEFKTSHQGGGYILIIGDSILYGEMNKRREKRGGTRDLLEKSLGQTA